MFDLISEPAISEVEFAQMYHYRLDRIKQAMAKQNVALCLLTNPVNMRYAADFNEYQLFQAHIPTASLLISADHQVTLFGASHRHYPNVDSYQPSRFTTPFDGGLDIQRQCDCVIADIEAQFRAMGLKPCDSSIALERISPLISQSLSAKGYRLVDAETLVEQAKLIKHPHEILCIRHSIAVAELGIKKMREALQPGISENQLWSLIHQVNIAHGGDWIEGKMLASGPRTNPWLQEATARIIQSGDLVAFDTDMVGPHGYLADISRTWLCGDQTATAEQKHAYRHAYDEIHYNMELLKPGVSFADLAKNAWPRAEEYREQRYVCAFHGAGMCDEHPKIYYAEDWDQHGFAGQLEPNMVVCVESYSGVKGGQHGVKLEEMVLITESGFERLTSYPFENNLLAC